MFYELRILATGVVIGYVLAVLSSDYAVVNRRKYEELKKKEK